MASQTKTIKILLIGILLILVGGIIYLANMQQSAGLQPDQVACTKEAMICPDGSSVGRTGPDCAFAPCPAPVANAGWKTTTSNGASFQYPEKLADEYVSEIDWPPAAQVLNEAFTCTEGGVDTERAGLTEDRTINGHRYCVTRVSEGAAGSIYTQYAYAFAKGDKTVILTFTTRTVQCLNYDEPKQSECKTVQAALDVDGIADKMAQSVVLN